MTDTEVVLTWSPTNWATVVLMGATFLLVVFAIIQISRRLSRKTGSAENG